jgi:hypothetical protein
VDTNDIYEEMDKINKRIRELVKKSGVGWYREGDKIRKTALTPEEKQELGTLRQRLEELKKEDDESQ